MKTVNLRKRRIERSVQTIRDRAARAYRDSRRLDLQARTDPAWTKQVKRQREWYQLGAAHALAWVLGEEVFL